jgi:hypothetical protein
MKMAENTPADRPFTKDGRIREEFINYLKDWASNQSTTSGKWDKTLLAKVGSCMEVQLRERTLGRDLARDLRLLFALHRRMLDLPVSNPRNETCWREVVEVMNAELRMMSHGGWVVHDATEESGVSEEQYLKHWKNWVLENREKLYGAELNVLEVPWVRSDRDAKRRLHT